MTLVGLARLRESLGDRLFPEAAEVLPAVFLEGAEHLLNRT